MKILIFAILLPLRYGRNLQTTMKMREGKSLKWDSFEGIATLEWSVNIADLSIEVKDLLREDGQQK